VQGSWTWSPINAALAVIETRLDTDLQGACSNAAAAAGQLAGAPRPGGALGSATAGREVRWTMRARMSPSTSTSAMALRAADALDAQRHRPWERATGEREAKGKARAGGSSACRRGGNQAMVSVVIRKRMTRTDPAVAVARGVISPEAGRC